MKKILFSLMMLTGISCFANDGFMMDQMGGHHPAMHTFGYLVLLGLLIIIIIQILTLMAMQKKK